MRLKFTQSARKHRIAKGRAVYVINSVDPEIRINDRDQIEYAWVGTDDRGVEIEIVGAQVNEDTTLVFHVMPTNFRRKR